MGKTGAGAAPKSTLVVEPAELTCGGRPCHATENAKNGSRGVALMTTTRVRLTARANSVSAGFSVTGAPTTATRRSTTVEGCPLASSARKDTRVGPEATPVSSRTVAPSGEFPDATVVQLPHAALYWRRTAPRAEEVAV